ncbi:MAG: BrnT family toxin [Opitutaceae bacterium]
MNALPNASAASFSSGRLAGLEQEVTEATEIEALVFAATPGEMRHLAIGFIAGKLWTVVYAPRDDPFQLISARRSRNHEKDSSSKPPGPTTAANPERRFNRGRDVFDYFDAARAVVTHGGVRPGAGRKPSGKLRKTVKLTPGAIRRFRAFARREKLADFSSALEAASRLV